MIFVDNWSNSGQCLLFRYTAVGHMPETRVIKKIYYVYFPLGSIYSTKAVGAEQKKKKKTFKWWFSRNLSLEYEVIVVHLMNI